MEVPAVAIGFPQEWVDEIKERAEVRYIASYEYVPQIFARDGVAFVESRTTTGRFLCPKIVLWYGYYPDGRHQRRALAVSRTPTYPDIRKTILWDDKMLSLIMVMDRDLTSSPRRGYCPPVAASGSIPAIPWPAETVLKWGNSHCGENKQLLLRGDEPLEGDGVGTHDLLSEPYIKGVSNRILVVEGLVSQLRYESEDWRKNVRGTIKKLDSVEPSMEERTRYIMRQYGLDIAGVDFVSTEDRDILLELNAYPSLDEDYDARERFLSRAIRAVRVAQLEDHESV